MNKRRPKGLKYKIVVKNKGWFKKGFTPWIAGKKGIRNSINTEFKKGNIPPLKLNPDMAKKGVDHPLWKGDEVGYHALHSWVKRKLGKPNHCAICQNNKLKDRQYHWANISKTYKRDLSDWIRLCVSCHKLLDLGKIKL